ncbi:glutamate-gated kainate-type ion channel receptor subunit GluR7 [Trifolium pratense]|uniref:Glutamate-gated kainate-type ion channel receptor subunit GluR14 n=1 Tax=Trifolium pratense TaxID=57577 RepID=A0A2K3NDG0_TRIPR|nr:glutamate-gated kainate-type ion channel receptor subunit GluR14 [Trifolium pratense]PNY01897.1 glutamate-gated kainate-type ion channel receptor subunit GluR15 [Trifolium pratense]PNY11990.1 glutamate-gated kainate-type ion channel receptor subunit GluR7 [Trifolium pratense]
MKWNLKLLLAHDLEGEMGVAEKVVGMEGGNVGGARLYFTILFCRLSLQTSGNCSLILSEATQSGGLSDIDFSSVCSFGRRSYLTQTGSFECVYFAWRLLRDRLPTKVNLVFRGIISLEARSCVAGCGGMKSA